MRRPIGCDVTLEASIAWRQLRGEQCTLPLARRASERLAHFSRAFLAHFSRIAKAADTS
jgi:hypothetical protein